MINVYKFESDTEENCRLKCLDELDVYNNEIITKEYEENNSYTMEVVKKEDIKKYIDYEYDYILPFATLSIPFVVR